MASLYITEQNAILRKTSDRLVLEKDGQVLLEVPCLKIDTVLLFGNVQFTTQALVEMLDHGIEMALFSSRGRLRGQLTPPKAKNVPLRMRQYEFADSRERCLEIAREIVRGKLANCHAVVQRFRSNHPQAISTEEAASLEADRDRATEASSLEILRGIEGSAAARYFPLLSRMLPEEFAFDRRNRRPPRDPFNALLSFGYVLVGNELQALLDGMGYDPYLGFYHQLDYARPSLALDLLEEFRGALVDRYSVKLLNLHRLGSEDFTTARGGGVYLTREGQKKYFAAYEEELATPFALEDASLSFRDVFRLQGHALARTLLQGEPYRSFRLPC